MKILAITGLVLALIGLSIGIYCQVAIMPHYNYLEAMDNLSGIDRDMFYAYSDTKFLLGSIALFVGPLAAILGIIAGIKKRKTGWIAAGLGLVSFILGAMQSTHIFS